LGYAQREVVVKVTFATSLSFLLLILVLDVSGCKHRKPYSGGGSFVTPPVKNTAYLDVGGVQKGCAWTFDATATGVNDGKGNSVDIRDDDTLTVVSATVTYNYSCGLPKYSEIAAPWGKKTSYRFKFPFNCTDTGSPSASLPMEYETFDEDVLKNNTCNSGGFSWPNDLYSYGSTHTSNWSSPCFDAVDDVLPYVIEKFDEEEGAASSVLYDMWSYTITEREGTLTFLSWDTSAEPDTAVYSSPCYSIPECAGNCTDIKQVNMRIEFYYFTEK
jgi:hypothetical protein